MPRRARGTPANNLVVLAALAGVVAGMYLARDLLIPLVLASLLCFLLLPIVDRLQRWRVPRVPAAVLATGVAVLILAGLAAVVAIQLISIGRMLPEYRVNIQRKLESVSGPASEPLTVFSDFLDRIGKPSPEAARQAAEGPPPDPNAPPPEEEPVPVTVVSTQQSTAELVRGWGATLFRPIAALGLVTVLVVFMLIQWESLRDRILRLFGQGRITVTTQAMDDFSRRVSRFLRVQLAVNLTAGAISAMALYTLGMPNALLWGILGAALRFIPYAGPITAAAMPFLVSFAISSDWWLPLTILAVFFTIEMIANNFVEPFLYGSSTGVSVFALLFAAVFWTWLWGWPGLLLSTPMTVGLAVAGRYVPQLHFLHILLGDSPPLSPQVRLYQRLLAMDPDEASEVATEYLEANSLSKLYDELLIPALRLAEQDREAGEIAEERLQFLYQTMRDIAEDAANLKKTAGNGDGSGSTPAQTGPSARPSRRILCIPAADEADAVTAFMLALLLGDDRTEIRTLSLTDMGGDLAAIFREFRPDVVCVSAMPPYAPTQARIRCRQIQHRVGGTVPTLVGLWGVRGNVRAFQSRLGSCSASIVVTTMTEAAARLPEVAGLIAAAGEQPVAKAG